MRIAEIFYSIQGEGILGGVPSAFVRTSGCPLRCALVRLPVHVLGARRRDAVRSRRSWPAWPRIPTRHVVVTGGEPVIAAGIEELCDAPAPSGTITSPSRRRPSASSRWRSTWPASAPSCPRPRRTSATAAASPCATTSSGCGPTSSAPSWSTLRLPAQVRRRSARRHRRDAALLGNCRRSIPPTVLLMPQGITPRNCAERGALGGGVVQAARLPLLPAAAHRAVRQHLRADATVQKIAFPRTADSSESRLRCYYWRK